MTFRLSAVVLLLSCAACAQDVKSIEKSIEKSLRQMKGKHLVLKNGYAESDLSFDASGRFLGKGATAPISLNGVFRVASVKVSGRTLEIKGERSSLFLDSRSQTIQSLTTGERVRVRLQASANIASLEEAEIMLAAVFLDRSYLNDLRANYWKQLLPEGKEYDEARKKGEAIGMLLGERPVYSVSPGIVEPPSPVFTPDPEYSNEARERKVSGTSVWRLYLNERGQPEIIEMRSALETTLDLRAVEALRKWRFRPATKAGAPVASRVDVEVSFKIY